jgi:hypothetical protein
MVSRRKLLVGISTVGVFSTIAGCSGGGEQNGTAQTENETEETDESENIESEGTDQIGSDIFVQNISFSYTFSGGLASVVEVTNNKEQGSGAVEVNISMEAYDGETELGEDSSWQGVEATAGESEYDENIGDEDEYYNRYAEEFELQISEVSQLADSSIDDVTEVVIRGRTQEQEYTMIETVSGSDLRDRVDS